MRRIGIVVLALVVSGCFGGGRWHHHIDRAAADRYAHRLHDVFYEAWMQPSTVTAPRGKISLPVDIQIDKDGRVAKFQITKSSGDSVIDDSIAAIAKAVRKVEPPPVTSRRGYYKLRIYFELDVK